MKERPFRKISDSLKKVYQGGSTDFLCQACERYFYVAMADEEHVKYCPFCGVEFGIIEDVEEED